MYQPHTCDLLAVGATNQIYRLNLSLGRFQSPLESSSPEINCIDYSSQLDLAATGGIDSRVEFWNLESRTKAHDLQLPESIQGQEITSVRFDPSSSLQFAVGTEKGKVLMYDMRYPVPVYTLNHHYRLPIKQIKFHEASKKVITCDKKIIKLFD